MFESGVYFEQDHIGVLRSTWYLFMAAVLALTLAPNDRTRLYSFDGASSLRGVRDDLKVCCRRFLFVTYLKLSPMVASATRWRQYSPPKEIKYCWLVTK